MALERERERESYSLENKVTLKKDATTVSYVNIRNCWTVWRESNILVNWGWQVCHF